MTAREDPRDMTTAELAAELHEIAEYHNDATAEAIKEAARRLEDHVRDRAAAFERAREHPNPLAWEAEGMSAEQMLIALVNDVGQRGALDLKALNVVITALKYEASAAEREACAQVAQASPSWAGEVIAGQIRARSGQ